MRKHHCRAMTLIELLVVIGITGILLCLLLPAVRAAREAARRAQCQNHLKQIGTAILLHEEAHGHLPTGGWGNQWIGDPDGGYEARQPGGWIYNILPYLEEQHVRNLGMGVAGDEKVHARAELFKSSMAVFICPSRRRAKLYKYTAPQQLRNVENPERAPKCDYAINGGDVVLSGGGGPKSLSRKDLQDYEWPSHEKFSGTSFVLSTVRLGQVIDGASKVYLVGEKLLHGESEQNYGDDQTLYVGDDADLRRWTAEPPRRDGSAGIDFEWFGSAHAAGCFFAMCDGSVQLVAYDIDPETHRRQGNRRDGLR